MTEYRIAWEPCPDCGRSSERPGGCYVVETKGLFGWKPFLVEYDRGGRSQAQHYPSRGAALKAYEAVLAPPNEKQVVQTWSRS